MHQSPTYLHPATTRYSFADSDPKSVTSKKSDAWWTSVPAQTSAARRKLTNPGSTGRFIVNDGEKTVVARHGHKV